LILRLLIDTLGGIDVRDCDIVTKRINALLDGELGDSIPERYILEVGSPGIERPLVKADDYIRFKGAEIRLRAVAVVEGRKTLQGILQGIEGETISILSDEELLEIPISSVVSANLVWRGDGGASNGG
jgi:ribosome maturation factor RimP